MNYSFTLPAAPSGSPMINYRKDAKKAIKFTIMVTGELGTGKSTFINCLLDRQVMPHAYEGSSVTQKTLAFTLASTVALSNTTSLPRSQFDPNSANEEPGIALTETSVLILDEDSVPLHLNIIDTPGLGDNLNNEMCFVEIEYYLKQQFDFVLAEETRIRRNPRFIDTRVHVLLYFITATGHGLREIDVQCMKRLARYVNIIPVIGRADTFTEAELKHFKNQIKIDIERFNVPIFQFDSFMDGYDVNEDHDLIQECKFLTKLQPFAIVASEQDFEIKDIQTGQSKTIKARQYPWGLVDISNPKYSDFNILKSVLFGSHLQDLKDLTHDFLYETYRTERLSEVTGKTDDASEVESQYESIHEQPILGAVPSMSNLAQLTKEGDVSMDMDGFQDDPQTGNTTMVSRNSPNPKSMLFPDDAHSKRSPHMNDSVSIVSSSSTVCGTSAKTGGDYNPESFKRLSIAPQRHQLRQISETVPYVIRHERILERQQKLEEIEMASARELASRAALLEQKAAELKAKEKLLMKKLEGARKAQMQRKSHETQESGHAQKELHEHNGHGDSENYTDIKDSDEAAE
ncbi:Septin [Metschnikowia bicuspidata]|uniref:Septin n=1 Tax=Metschnikowia bicuspidata TaxID=27322 RepID=A0A4P9ZBU5_9ASCO|nr:Septin [Metschnikowia bicuspidata]